MVTCRKGFNTFKIADYITETGQDSPGEWYSFSHERLLNEDDMEHILNVATGFLMANTSMKNVLIC